MPRPLAPPRPPPLLASALVLAALLPLALPPAAAQAPSDGVMFHVDDASSPPRYLPAEAVVLPGSLVQLMLFGGPPHSVTLDAHPEYDADVPTGNGVAEFRAPATPGTYAFHDKHDPSMRGRLVVRPAEGAEPPATTPESTPASTPSPTSASTPTAPETTPAASSPPPPSPTQQTPALGLPALAISAGFAAFLARRRG